MILRKIKKYAKKILVRDVIKTPVHISVLYGSLLEGKTALITGGTRGIGFEISKAFLRNGASVVITGRNSKTISDSVSKLLATIENEPNRVWGIELDNGDSSSFNEKFEEICSMIGPEKNIDILVNNAGIIQGGAYGTVLEEEFDNVININLKGVYLLSQIVAKHMKNNEISGNILNMASSSSLRPAVSPYSISKWGIRGLTLGLAKSLIPHGIVVNGLAPGPTSTDMLGIDESKGIDLPKNPIGRYATPEEISNLAVILVSGISNIVVGDIIYASGGSGLITLDDVSYKAVL
jgi:NAD(P)-dependent dehydrogenase (short-subunit alcohol dehydrogenase family)